MRTFYVLIEPGSFPGRRNHRIVKHFGDLNLEGNKRRQKNAQIAKTKILKFARVSAILTVMRSEISTFVIIFPFWRAGIHCEGRYVPTQHRLLVIFIVLKVFLFLFSNIHIFSIKSSFIKVSTIFHHFLYFRFECAAFIVNYLLLFLNQYTIKTWCSGRLGISHKINVIFPNWIMFLVPEIVIGLW